MRANGAAEAEPTVDEPAQGVLDAADSTDEQMPEEIDEAGDANAESEKDANDSEAEQVTEPVAVPAERRRRSPQGESSPLRC